MMTTANTANHLQAILQHIERRVSLNEEEKNYIASAFSIRELLPRQYLRAQEKSAGTRAM